ncbi:ABC transporter ATP-binding protein [Cohnella rhizosphaerae]|uniref:ABC transporter ATP-binding protein n=1 Tax=Cohnella rhizosphaerae TaxID=1457232 RepID=A0A9X4KVD9_9BACL|nr:ABC transporter ATP-binding protein [Cohnella rhizosphaerae]MDG0811815.1 ABC transporter ATP-binding protein [Cohnella rhizosphaerae]
MKDRGIGLSSCLQKKKRYKEIQSISDVSFEVLEGQTFGIIGRNGAGKSTILQIIAGTLHPTSGSVSVKGRVVALLELGAGFNMEFTGEENVYLYGSILGLSKQEIKEKYNDILAFASIGEFINYPVKTYSSGMFVRLAFSVAIHVDPQVLIIDEALSVGDVAFQHKCMAKLKQLQRNGCTILFVSHDIDSVKSLCDEAILLHRGRLLNRGKPEDIANQYFAMIHEEQLTNRKVEEMQLDTHLVEDSIWATGNDSFEHGERHGSGEAIIARLRFLNEQMLEIDQVPFGRALYADLFVRYNQPVTSEINVGVLFRDDKGLDILGDDSWNHKCILPIGEAGSKIIIRFKWNSFILKPGSYAITVALGAMNANRTQWNDYYYDWIERAAFLQVKIDPVVRVWSKVLLPAEVRIL